ncbi:unnamed protein product [Jaminaea pallidilutea]
MSSSFASTSRLTPLTPAHPEDDNRGRGTSVPASRDSYVSSYSSRMGSLSRSSSISSNRSSPASSRRSSMSATASAKPVVRGGFVIPAITLTPPDERPQSSQSLPWQDFTSKSSLYVPVKTEDIGWEEGGLWWHGTWHYREVLLYGGEDDRAVGKYRGGPDGYAYTEVWDKKGFEHHQAPRKMDEPAPQRPSGKSSSSSSSSSSGSASKVSSSKQVAKTNSSLSSASVAPAEPLQSVRRESESSVVTDDSSPCSSRRTSASTADTAVTTPCDSPTRLSVVAGSKPSVTHREQLCDSPVSEINGSGGSNADKFDDELSKALHALRDEKKRHGGSSSSSGSVTRGERLNSIDDVAGDASSCLATPKQLQLGKSITISNDGPSASHQWPKGRGVAKIAAPVTAASAASSAISPPRSRALPSASASSRTRSFRGASAGHFVHDQELGYSC